jgi:tRNA pseudouridine38-40 synthase
VDFKYELDNTAYRLNRILSDDIRINQTSRAPTGFNARFSATARSYEYRLLDGNRLLAPLARYNTATWYRNLDLTALNQASQVLLGEHDFAAFCKYREGATSIRNLCEFNWRRNDENLLIASISADAFCYNMVRNLVGAVVCVGEGRVGIDWIQRVLSEKSRVSDSYVFPARGLTLTSVSYPSDEQLALQVERVMSKRELAAD